MIASACHTQRLAFPGGHNQRKTAIFLNIRKYLAIIYKKWLISGGWRLVFGFLNDNKNYRM